jgi:uncharacterized protein (DUF2235 family)
MKRIVILIDGTWNEEGKGNDTNIAKLDPAYRAEALIKARAADGVVQLVSYHKGVGADPDFLKHILGGAVGIGLKQIIQDACQAIVRNYEQGDEIYILGFSRGAYAARALAGLIGASGIQRFTDKPNCDAAWNYYRVEPAVRAGAKFASVNDQKAIESFDTTTVQNEVRPDQSIKCVGVFDTVGSYGIPAGIGLAPLARYVALETLGFPYFGSHIEVGLHAIAVDEPRRPFVPTFWTAPKEMPSRGHVEQTWFAGAHCNVGGGYPDSGLSDQALIWMIARIQALTHLEFSAETVKALAYGANVKGEVYDSSKGWIVDEAFPHFRVILSPDAIGHGMVSNTPNPKDEHINERIHWSVVEKLGKACTVAGIPNTPITHLEMFPQRSRQKRSRRELMRRKRYCLSRNEPTLTGAPGTYLLP